MKNRFMKYFYWFAAVFPFLLSAAFYRQMPQQMAIHWDSADNPDGFAPRLFGTFGLPTIMLLVILFVNFSIYADPKKQNIERSPQMKFILRWFVVILANFAQFVTILKNRSNAIRISGVITVLVGLLIAVIGNYLPKLKYNYTIGIKLPWTLASEENWRKTHRFSGFVWIIGGILLAVTAFFPYKWFSVSIFILLVVIPAIYSYRLSAAGEKNSDRNE
jgi:uncharacterized membrane protein